MTIHFEDQDGQIVHTEKDATIVPRIGDHVEFKGFAFYIIEEIYWDFSNQVIEIHIREV